MVDHTDAAQQYETELRKRWKAKGRMPPITWEDIKAAFEAGVKWQKEKV